MHVLVTHLIASTSEETREPFPFLLASKQSSIVISCLDSFPRELDVYLLPVSVTALPLLPLENIISDSLRCFLR